LVTYSCDTSADIITLTNSILDSKDGAKYHYSDIDGTYSPWNLVDIEQKNNHSRIIRTKKIIKTCTLSTGQYTVTLEPQIFNRDINSECGASISSAVTISYNGIDIQERTPFEDYCRGNAPIVTRITVFGRTSEVKIKRVPRYKFH